MTDAWNVACPAACPVCGRDSCEDHLPAPATPVAMTLADLRAYRFPPSRPLLMRGTQSILSAGHLAQVHAERGIGKTWLLQSLAIAAAAGIDVLGFRAPASCRVLVIDGEMDSHDLQDRYQTLTAMLGVSSDIPLTVLAADWQRDYLPRLDTAEGQAYVAPYVADADLVVLDNRSCLFDPEGEKDPTAWQPAQEWLLGLRRQGKAVIIAHHSNRQGGSRGHSKSEDPLNLILKLARPEDYSADHGARFTVTFEKTRGAFGADVSPFTARLTPEGWRTESASERSLASRLLEHVRLADGAGDPVKSATAAIRAARVNRENGLKAWADLIKSGQLQKHPTGGFRAA